MKADALLLVECCFNYFFCRMNSKILGAEKSTPLCLPLCLAEKN